MPCPLSVLKKEGLGFSEVLLPTYHTTRFGSFLMLSSMLRLYGKDLEENSHGLVQVLFWHLPEGTEEKSQNSIGIASL
jgi:hypothetical protein